MSHTSASRRTTPPHQTFWEMLACMLCLMTWIKLMPNRKKVLLVGDNLGSLQNTLDMKGQGPLLAIAREVAWCKVRLGWNYDAAHIPSEHNTAPDALSRLHSPEPPPLPTEILGSASRKLTPTIGLLWKLKTTEES